ncbi:acyltransferase [Ruminococcus sp. OM05-10BH]|nr:acyltransferase [Ruminococcus sp. OM05-10BH]
MEPNNENNRILIGGGYRNEAISLIRFLSMLMIISCHIMQYYDLELAWWFNVGVQIFLCISGFLYGQKNIEDATDFYNKRFKKILIPYYLVFIPFGIIEFIFARDVFSTKAFAMGLILCSTIKGAEHLWFIPTILMCYLITPLLQGYRNKCVEGKRTIVIFTVLGVIITSVLIQGFTTFNPAWICCYLIGYALGMNEKGKYIRGKVLMAITGIIAVAGNAVQIYCDYIASIDFSGFGIIKNYNHVMLGVFIFLLLKVIFEKVDLNGIGKLLKLSDAYSFEVYLVHQLLILGPFSLMALTGYSLINILIVLLGICVLTLLLKKAEQIVEGMFISR